MPVQAPENDRGFYERNRIMGRSISNVELPATTRKLTYDYADSLDSVKSMLAEGQTPGDGPFETQGKARAAANSLLAQLGEDGKQYGARTVQKDDDWYFGLKSGRKEYHGRKAAAEGDGNAAPAKAARQSGAAGAKAKS